MSHNKLSEKHNTKCPNLITEICNVFAGDKLFVVIVDTMRGPDARMTSITLIKCTTMSQSVDERGHNGLQLSYNT